MCVWGLPPVGLVGCGADGAPGWPVSVPLAGGRIWTLQVAFQIVDPGRRQGPGLGLFVGAWCRGVAQAGGLWLPSPWDSACFPSREVVPAAAGLLWLRDAAAGIVVVPVWLHVLVGGFVACPPPIALELP